MKRIITYLLYVSGLLLLVYYGAYHQEELRIIASENFNWLPPRLFSSVYSVMIGVYIALPGFINTLRRTGKVHVDWLRILIIGIPTLLIGISGILYYYLTPLDLSFLVQRVMLSII